MKTRFAGPLALLLSLSIPGWNSDGAQFAAQLNPAATEWSFTLNGAPVMVYSVDPQQYKPYVKELWAANGRNLLRDAPFDHLHHHALMYGIRVNGLNFWEETAGMGVQKVIHTDQPELGELAGGRPQATLRQRIHWLAPEHAFLPDTNAPVLLVEQRTLTLTVDRSNDEVALRWHSRFQVGNRTNLVALAGANYHGVGMRFAQDLDASARHFTPEGSPDLSGTKQDVSRHRWEAVAFDQADRPATIVLAGSPANARGEPWFFAMKRPFAYLSATQNLDQEPLVYRSGESFELSYLVLVYPRAIAAETISGRVTW